MSEQHKPRTLRLEPAVPEEWIRRVMKQDVSPTEFAEWLLARADLDELLAEYGAQGGNWEGESRDTAQPDRTSDQVRRWTAVAQPVPEDEAGWTKESFFAFLEVVSSIRDLEWSMALLNAYLELGPLPSSEDLQAMCGFDQEYAWHQELRIAKQRLTLQARQMGAPPLFPRAKTAVGGTRLHPIEPRLFPWLKEWAEARHHAEGGIEGSGLPEPEHWGPTVKKSGKYEEEKA